MTLQGHTRSKIKVQNEILYMGKFCLLYLTRPFLNDICILHFTVVYVFAKTVNYWSQFLLILLILVVSINYYSNYFTY